MSTEISISKFNIFKKLDKKLCEQINKFYLTKYYLLFVTFDHFHQYKLSDKLKNEKNHESHPFQEKEVIIKLDCSHSSDFPHFIALIDNGGVYSWGNNEFGQLGNGTNISRSSPELIDFLSNENVVDICCGKHHSIMLTNEGKVFCFGWNCHGQCGNCTIDNVLTPTQAALNVKVTAISSGENHSIAITENGEVYGWGWNLFGQLGIEDIEIKPVPTKINNHINIIEVVCGICCTLLLSTDGEIYFCGEVNDILSINLPTKIESSIKFTKIAASNHSRLCVALSEDNVCYIFRNLGERHPQKTDFTSIYDIFAHYEQITYKTSETNASKYNICFTEICSIGFGATSTVFKSQHKKNNLFYAIKKAGFKHEDQEIVTKELKFLKHLDSEYFVKFVDAWVESNYYRENIYFENSQNNSSTILFYSPHSTHLLHIQMELCLFTLRDAINTILNKCKTPKNTLSLIGYYISSELLFEILECLQYLHSQIPKAIIHRDIKPENILITNFQNHRFVKLSDFGLSTFHVDNQSHTKKVGTTKYKAPELDTSTHYSTKADIYSLGVLIQEMFIIDLVETEKIYNAKVKNEMNNVESIVKKLLSAVPQDRPNCDQLLKEQYLWRLKDKQLIVDEDFQIILNSSKVKSIEQNFIEYFIQNKYPYSKNAFVNEPDFTKIFSNSVLNISSHLWSFFILNQNNPNNKSFFDF